jgi:hypothetical protein
MISAVARAGSYEEDGEEQKPAGQHLFLLQMCKRDAAAPAGAGETGRMPGDAWPAYAEVGTHG